MYSTGLYFLLQSKEPQIPLYDALNLQIKSYDFTVLESFSSYIHKTAENMEIEVEDWYSFIIILKYLMQYQSNYVHSMVV